LQSGAFIFDLDVFFDTTPIGGMSGSPVYIYDSSGQIKVLSIVSNIVDYTLIFVTEKDTTYFYILPITEGIFSECIFLIKYKATDEYIDLPFMIGLFSSE
jgi:hypothetical protein